MRKSLYLLKRDFSLVHFPCFIILSFYILGSKIEIHRLFWSHSYQFLILLWAPFLYEGFRGSDGRGGSPRRGEGNEAAGRAEKGSARGECRGDPPCFDLNIFLNLWF